jgi:hypothetical protein
MHMAQLYVSPDGSGSTMRRDLTELTPATRSIRLTVLEQIEQIKAENPDLYEALARDNPDLIR